MIQMRRARLILVAQMAMTMAPIALTLMTPMSYAADDPGKDSAPAAARGQPTSVPDKPSKDAAASDDASKGFSIPAADGEKETPAPNSTKTDSTKK